MSAPDPRPPRPSRDLRAYRRRTQRQLVLGFFLLLFIVGGGLILWRYGWGGLIGGLACILAFLGVLGLIWLFLTLAGRWAGEDDR